jgi:hypothetical protein
LLRLLFNSEDGGDMFLRKPNDYWGTRKNYTPGIELFVSTAVGNSVPKLLSRLTLYSVVEMRKPGKSCQNGTFFSSDSITATAEYKSAQRLLRRTCSFLVPRLCAYDMTASARDADRMLFRASLQRLANPLICNVAWALQSKYRHTAIMKY